MESNLPADWQNLRDHLYSTTHGKIIEIVSQTLLYGIYLCLIPITVHAMITNGLHSRARKWLLVILTCMFTLMTTFWILSVFFTTQYIDSLNNSVTICHSSNNAPHCVLREVAAISTSLSASAWLSTLFDILLINFLIADGVVVWRAWVLCADQSKVVLMIPVVMLGINTVIYLMTVTARAVQFISYNRTGYVRLRFLIDFGQVAHLTFSLLINISATSIIAFKTWKYRKLLMEGGIGVQTPTQTTRILALLVESGMIYILIGVTSVTSIIISLRFGLKDISAIFTLVSIQLTGIYPIVVILLVEKNRSLNSTFSSGTMITSVRTGDRPSQAEPITFVPGPVLASGGQIDLTKSSNTEFHVTLYSALEQGDVEMSPGSSKVLNEEPIVS